MAFLDLLMLITYSKENIGMKCLLMARSATLEV